MGSPIPQELRPSEPPAGTRPWQWLVREIFYSPYAAGILIVVAIILDALPAYSGILCAVGAGAWGARKKRKLAKLHALEQDPKQH